mgnify:CR=1 FL=1
MRAASMATHQPSSSRAITCQPSGVTLVRWCGMRSVGSTRTVSRQQTASQRSQRFLMEKARKMRRRHRTPAALAPYTLGVSGCEPYPGGSCIRHVRPRIGVDVDGTVADRFGCRSKDAALNSVLCLHAPHAVRRPGSRCRSASCEQGQLRPSPRTESAAMPSATLQPIGNALCLCSTCEGGFHCHRRCTAVALSLIHI